MLGNLVRRSVIGKLLKCLVLILISTSCAIQYQAHDVPEPRCLTVYTNMLPSKTASIINKLPATVVAVKPYKGRTSSHKAIINDVMRLKDTGKILVLVERERWYCGWLMPCIFGATETINWDRAYATGEVSAVHETKHLFGWRDIF